MYHTRSDMVSKKENKKMYYTKFDTLFCEIILIGNEEGLSGLRRDIGEGRRCFDISDEWIMNDVFFENTANQLKEYFRGKRQKFNVKLNPLGTDFQKRVWRHLGKIAYGELCTYKEIAKAIGNEKASRAVGMANSKNPIPLVIPCHRVIGSNGSLTGFAHGLAIKEKLIHFERTSLANSSEL